MRERLTAADLAAMEARAQAAPAGPWWFYADRDSELYPIMAQCGQEDVVIGQVYMEDRNLDRKTAQFIAHAREDVPCLLAEVRRLRNELDTVCAVVARPVPPSVSGDPLSRASYWKAIAEGLAALAREALQDDAR